MRPSTASASRTPRLAMPLGVGGEEAGHDVAQAAALVGQADPDRAAVDLAALVVHVAELHQPLEVVADVRALVVAAGLELPRRHLVVADVEEQERLDGVESSRCRAARTRP